MIHGPAAALALSCTAAAVVCGAAGPARSASTDPERPTHRVALNPAPLTPVLKRPASAHRLLYTGRLFGPLAIRLAADGRYSSADNEESTLTAAAGVQWEAPMSTQWVFFVGLEARYTYSRFNGRSYRWHRYGLHPLAGAMLFLGKNVSVGTEVMLDVVYNVQRDPQAFDPAANSDSLSVDIGSLGALQIAFHF